MLEEVSRKLEAQRKVGPFPIDSADKPRWPLQERTAMINEEKTVVCGRCGKHFRAAPRITLLGFQKFDCPKCQGRIIYPLLKRSYYWIILAVIGVVLLLSLSGLHGGDLGANILTFSILGALYVLERATYILFPLAAWAILRLAGMYYPSALQASRTILWYTGIAALAGILIGVLGGVASLVWAGRVIETLTASILLFLFFLLVLARDRLIRKGGLLG